MSKSSIENRRKSVVISGLIGSAGIFVSKFIGLFYAVPFSAILGSDVNSAYYGVAFQLYSYLLNICTAGFPFAIATLVAKYMARDDYATTYLVKKLSSVLMCLDLAEWSLLSCFLPRLLHSLFLIAAELRSKPCVLF